jgi:hypothetical protein
MPAEDGRADAGDDEDDPELLQMGVAVEGPGQHLFRSYEDAQAPTDTIVHKQGNASPMGYPSYSLEVEHV